jgi:hypothetical protein
MSGGDLYVAQADTAGHPTVRPVRARVHARVLLIPNSRRLFIGAGTRLLSYHSRSGAWRRHWVDEAELGFWGWRQHGDVVLMSAEIELAAWTVTDDKLWTTFVQPPWFYRITGNEVLSEVMDTTTTVNITIGPQTP